MSADSDLPPSPTWPVKLGKLQHGTLELPGRFLTWGMAGIPALSSLLNKSGCKFPPATLAWARSILRALQAHLRGRVPLGDGRAPKGLSSRLLSSEVGCPSATGWHGSCRASLAPGTRFCRRWRGSSMSELTFLASAALSFLGRRRRQVRMSPHFVPLFYLKDSAP